MAKLRVEVVTAEGRTLSEDADFVLAPGIGGEVGILPRHIPMLTPLRTGEVLVRNDGKEQFLSVSGGFLEVLPDKVTILADAAERAASMDEARAEAAKLRAKELLKEEVSDASSAATLERGMYRVRVSDVRRRRRGGGGPPAGG